MTFSIVACPLLARQGWKNEVMRHQRGLDRGGLDPAQRCKMVGLIRRASERSDGDRQAAVDSGVAAMQGSGRGPGLIERAEHHREDHGEGAMKRPIGSSIVFECSAMAAATHR